MGVLANLIIGLMVVRLIQERLKTQVQAQLLDRNVNTGDRA
jgi:uncharacterized membrane-anchored protein YhcB (DUF1043 family)